MLLMLCEHILEIKEMKIVIRSYHELRLLQTFDERYDYLKLGGIVGKETFGSERYLNQLLYHSGEWEAFRNEIIVRDNGCDLGIKGREIFSKLVIHHINPITIEDIEQGADCVFDPDNAICTMHSTHMAIHYGDISMIIRLSKERKKGDTLLWTAY